MTAELNRLRWRCRRGVLELDIALARFLETKCLQLDARQRESFERLLEAADEDLWRWINGDEHGLNPAWRDIVAALR